VRIARLIAMQNVDPASVLAITFTNKAAEEMAGRLAGLLGHKTAGQIVIKTFHAFGAMLLRQAGDRLGLSPHFAIAAEADQQTVLKACYPQAGSREINDWLAAISAAKSQALTPDETEGDFADIYRTYETALHKNALVDFDDLVLKAVQLLEQHHDLQAAYRQRFHWLSVDEFQDVNAVQYRLLQQLIGPETSVCLIGDPDQAIYGFRGATPRFFAQFVRDYAPVETLHLSQNYRSTQLILDASVQVIEKSAASERVRIFSEILDPTRLTLYQAPTEAAEAEYVVHTIEKMIGGTSYFSLDSARVDDDGVAGLSFADFAILYRLSAQSRSLVEAFERSGIPYQTVGQTPLVEYKDVRLVLACLWYLFNPAHRFYLDEHFSKMNASALAALLSDLVASGLRPLPELIDLIQHELMARALLPGSDSSHARIQQLRRRSVLFDRRLGDFLEAVLLQNETDFYDPRADRVTLMSLHAAKGLEFPVVFIVGCESELLPYHRAGEAPDLEEERRLFYVGMTRAQQRLILTRAKSRVLFGQRMENPPSPFLDDIEQALKEIEQARYRKPIKEGPEHVQLKLF
ncbi:MAG: UvrD-helicase domain-containing protein, partial [Anaerolineae bacterium]|nr:UvrD-helicase domain-containing protein [Anaerolineae bacterium]